jgi:dTDP-4-dehydrorhamnose reductase
MLELLRLGKYGTYHMVCEGHGTRFDVAKEIVRICGRSDISVVPVNSSFFREEYPAPRPRSEMLRNANLEELGINQMRSWRDALRAYIENDYPHVVQQDDRSRRVGRPGARAPLGSPPSQLE